MNYFARIKLSLYDKQFILTQVRSLFGTTSFLLFTFNLQLIPITLIIIFFQTNPLWSAILGFLFNGETVSAVELTAMLLSFAGVIVIAIARSKSQQDQDSLPDTSAGQPASLVGDNAVLLGVILTLCHAWLFSGVGVISRRLQRVHFTELMLHQSVQGVILISGYMLYLYFFHGVNYLGQLEMDQLGQLTGGSLADSIALVSMCIAFQSDSTSIVSMVGYLAIVYALFTDLFVFGERLSKVELLGCAFVITITLLMGLYRMAKANHKPNNNLESQASEKLLGDGSEADMQVVERTSSYLSQHNEFADHSFHSRNNNQNMKATMDQVARKWRPIRLGSDNFSLKRERSLSANSAI